jgi:Ca-activated chloride channel homolog
MKTSNKSIEIEPGIHLRMVPSTPYLLSGVENRLYALIELKADEPKEDIKRPRYNLALILDRSGSMEGNKLQYAKEAIKLILKNLHTKDTLHLVTYDYDIERVFVNGKKDQEELLIQKIKQITSRGTTNLAGGLLEGQKILAEVEKNQDESLRVFLFSDGLANEGITDKKEIFQLTSKMHQQGINTTAFGIGEDFDEKMMTGIGEHGRGDYFFIEHADSIPHIVEESIQGLLKTVAMEVEMKIRGTEGSVVTKLYLHDVMKGAILGDLRGGETRRIIAELKVDPSKMKDEFLKVDISLRSIEDLTTPVNLSYSLEIPITADETLLVEDEEVMTFKVQAEIVEEELKIYDFLQNRNYDQAKTLNDKIFKQLQSTKFRDKEGLIQDKLENIEDMAKYIEDAKLSDDYSAAMKRSSYYSSSSMSSRRRHFKEKYRDD